MRRSTSAMGHERTRICAAAMPASHQQADILNSLLVAMLSLFAIKKIPRSDCREFLQRDPRSKEEAPALTRGGVAGASRFQ
jgi:hypothetical protein